MSIDARWNQPYSRRTPIPRGRPGTAFLAPALSLLALLASDTSRAQEMPGARPPEQVLLFKSGQGWVQRQVPIPEGAEEVETLLPPGILGTIWVGSASHDVLGAEARMAPREVSGEVEDLVGILRAATGRKVMLQIATGSGFESASGELVRLIGPMAEVAAGQEPEPAPPAAAILRQGTQLISVPVSRIAGVVMQSTREDAAPPDTWKAQVKIPVLAARVKPGPESAASPGLTLTYLANGLAWAPSYVLTLTDEGRGRLVGKAVVINELEDLEDTRVMLVVGFPNIRYAGIQSPLLPHVSVEDLRQQLEQGDREDRLDFLSNVLGQRAEAARRGGAPSGPVTEVSGESAEDLYIYDVARLTLEKGQRAYVPLLEADVPLEHRYDWEVPDLVDQNARFRGGGDTEPPPVWHVVMLTNETEAPWTTAPVLIAGSKGPLAQSDIDYTPVSQEAKVELTKALDLVGDVVEHRSDEREADRTSVQLFGRHYEQVTVEGSLELSNEKDEAVPVRVRKHLSGDVVSASGEPEIESVAKSLGSVNASRTIVWRFELEAGAIWTADYTYRVLIRR